MRPPSPGDKEGEEVLLQFLLGRRVLACLSQGLMTPLPQGKSIRDTLLLHPSTGCHQTPLQAPARAVWTPGCRWDMGGPSTIAQTLGPRQSRAETSRKQALVWGNHQMELFHISSQTTSAHTWIPSMASLPSPSPPEYSGPPAPPWGRWVAKNRARRLC